jgi:hypothetical protein
MIKCWGGCNSRDVLTEMERLGLLDDHASDMPADPGPIERQRERDHADRRRRTANALDLFLMSAGRRRTRSSSGIGALAGSIIRSQRPFGRASDCCFTAKAANGARQW